MIHWAEKRRVNTLADRGNLWYFIKGTWQLSATSNQVCMHIPAAPCMECVPTFAKKKYCTYITQAYTSHTWSIWAYLQRLPNETHTFRLEGVVVNTHYQRRVRVPRAPNSQPQSSSLRRWDWSCRDSSLLTVLYHTLSISVIRTRYRWSID